MLSNRLQPCQCASRRKPQGRTLMLSRKQRTCTSGFLPVSTNTARSVAASAAATGHLADAATYTGPQAILDRYRALLHEYRQHKSALADWLKSVTHAKHRPAQLLDAEATGDAALVSRFQQYLMIRKRLMAEIPLMREQLEEAEQQVQAHKTSSSSSSTNQLKRRPNSSSTGSHGVVNANLASPVSRSQAVGQFFAAVNYRNKNGLWSQGVSTSSGRVASSEQPLVPVPVDVAVVEQQSSVSRSAAGTSSTSQVAATVSSSSTAPLSSDNSKLTMHANNSSDKAEALSHLLSASSDSSSATTASSRATAAALAALAYKKQKQSGTAAAVNGNSSQQQQRPLAIQLTESPPPPPGYSASSGSSSSSSSDVIGVVETAKGDVNALRSNRRLESDVSLEATLQGVPGGLGATDSSAMFAATITSSATERSASPGTHSGSRAGAAVENVDPVLAAAAAATASGNSTEPVGEVVTAKFDVYQGRKRMLDVSALDEYFASLAEGHSMQLSAAVSPSSGMSQAAESVSRGKQPPQQACDGSAGHSQQKGSAAGGGSSSIDNNGSSESLIPGLCLPGDVLPLPT